LAGETSVKFPGGISVVNEFTPDAVFPKLFRATIFQKYWVFWVNIPGV
jgi:hypothetical protein